MAKVGATHAAAMGRQGLRELRGAIYPESNIAQSPEIGVFGTATQGEVASDRREQTFDLEEEKPLASSTLDQRMPSEMELKTLEQDVDKVRD